jgi:hypothetical protein
VSDFWARRRAGVEAEAAAEAEARENAREAAEAEGLAGLDDAEVLERLGLPDPDDLRPGDDVTGFMARVVPTHLRNRALRRLWVSNPVLANLDGLADYAEDFTGDGLKGAAIRTTYEVGRGLSAHVRKVAEEAAARAEAEGAAEQHKVKESETESRLWSESTEKTFVAEPADMGVSPGIPSDSDTGGREDGARRRLRFSFEEDDGDERADSTGSDRSRRGA